MERTLSRRRSLPALTEANRRCPTGRIGYWKIIRELDAKGPWTGRQVSDRTYDDRNAVNIFIAGLVAHGYAEIVATVPSRNVRPANVLRLVRRPMEPPEVLGSAGSERSDLKTDAIWRTMKMLHRFTPRSLVEGASLTDRPVSLLYVRNYVSLLVKCGIVQKVGKKPVHGEATYRIAVNLGGRAPKMLRHKVLFDPNAGKFLVRIDRESLGSRAREGVG